MDIESNHEGPTRSPTIPVGADARQPHRIWAETPTERPSPAQLPGPSASVGVSMSPTIAPPRSPEVARNIDPRSPALVNLVESATDITAQAGITSQVNVPTVVSRNPSFSDNLATREQQMSGSGVASASPPVLSPIHSTHDPSRSPVASTGPPAPSTSNGAPGTPSYQQFMSALATSQASGSQALIRPPQPLRKRTPEIIDLTGSPFPSRDPSPAAMPQITYTTEPWSQFKPPGTWKRGEIYDPEYARAMAERKQQQSSLVAIQQAWTPAGPSYPPPVAQFQRPPAGIAPTRRPTLPPDPKEVIDLSVSDQEDEEMQDAPPVVAPVIRVNPRTAASSSGSPEDGSQEGRNGKVLTVELLSPPGSDDEPMEDKELHLKILKAPDVFVVGESHYACTRETLKKEPKVLSKAEEKEVTDWYRGSYKRRQEQLEAEPKNSKIQRGRISLPDPDTFRNDRPTRAWPLGGGFERISGTIDFTPPPPPPGMRFPMGQGPMVPPMMSNIHFVPYINNAKLPPLTLKGNGNLVPGTCRKLFRRYRLEMCHGCDTKQRCSKKDMWKMPDLNDPLNMLADGSSGSNGHGPPGGAGGYPPILPHPDMMRGMPPPMGGMPPMGPPGLQHPAFYGPPPHGPYPPGYPPPMHSPPAGYSPYPPPPHPSHRHTPPGVLERPGGPPRPGPSRSRGSPPITPSIMPLHHTDYPQVAGHKRPASPYA